MRFPMLESAALDGRNLVLPRDFDGKYNIAVIAFRRDQQNQVGTWRLALDELRSRFKDISTYEMMVIQYLPYWQQAAHDVSLRQRMEVYRRATTLALYVDLNDFNRALDIPTVSSIYTMLIDRDGCIHWRSHGVCDTARCNSLTRAVRRLAGSPVAAVR